METVISNFAPGLDSRRSELTSKVGVLDTALDVHINQGSEIEKRRAFVDFGINATTAFGIEVTSAGLVAFGSVTTPALATGVGYVRCQHPSDNTKSMTAILCSCSFGGNTFCAAQFSNGDVFLYYNGTVIPASTNGRVLSAAITNLAVATQLYAFLNTTYFTSLGINAIAPVANGTAYYVDVYGVAGVAFSLTPPVVTSATGLISTQLISSAQAGKASTQAQFAFTVGMGVTGSLSTIFAMTDGATFNTSLLPSAVPWVTADLLGYQTALNVAAIISSSLTAFPVRATANNNQVAIAADSLLGATPNGYPVKLNTTGDFCLDQMIIDFTAVATLSSSSLLVGSLATVFANQNYNVGGTYTTVTIAAGIYWWRKGVNDTSLVVGATTFYQDNTFTLGAPATVQFNGLASSPVTAQLTLMVQILRTSGSTTGTTIPLFVANLATQIRTFCTANALKYTACASTYNVNQLVVSRNEIDSRNQFLPIVATDVAGAVSVIGTVSNSIPVINFSYIQIQNNTNPATGVINVSIFGGVSPYFFTLVQVSNPSGLPWVVLLPDASSPFSSTGSFLITVSLGGSVGGGYTANVVYTLTGTDAAGNSKSVSINLSAVIQDGSHIRITATFT